MKTQRCLTIVIAMLVFIPLNQERIRNVQGASAGIETSTVAPGLPPQERTVLINLVNQHYVPPKRTLKIPPGFRADSEKAARLAVRVGDTLKLCNIDSIRYRPFSYSPENKFESVRTLGQGGILQGQCWTYVVKNSTQHPIAFTLSDDIHASQKLSLVVLPANYPDEGEEDTPDGENNSNQRSRFSLSGTWKCDDGGTYTLDQSGTVLTWEASSPDNGASWDHKFTGVIEGSEIKGNFQDHPPGWMRGHGRLTFKIVSNNRLERTYTEASFGCGVLVRQR